MTNRIYGVIVSSSAVMSPAPGSGLVKHSPDFAFLAVCDVERAVRGDRHAVGPRRKFRRVTDRGGRKSVSKNLELAAGFATREGLEDDRAGPFFRRPVPGAMKGDQSAAAILGRKLVALIKGHIHGCPMRRKAGD